jgi:PIN domain-containing protein
VLCRLATGIQPRQVPDSTCQISFSERAQACAASSSLAARRDQRIGRLRFTRPPLELRLHLGMFDLIASRHVALCVIHSSLELQAFGRGLKLLEGVEREEDRHAAPVSSEHHGPPAGLRLLDDLGGLGLEVGQRRLLAAAEAEALGPRGISLVSRGAEIFAEPETGHFPCPNRRRRDALIEQIRTAGVAVASRPLAVRLPDPDDEAFLEVVLAGDARCLVTGNLKHYSAAAKQGIEMLAPRPFIETYRRSSE